MGNGNTALSGVFHLKENPLILKKIFTSKPSKEHSCAEFPNQNLRKIGPWSHGNKTKQPIKQIITLDRGRLCLIIL